MQTNQSFFHKGEEPVWQDRRLHAESPADWCGKDTSKETIDRWQKIITWRVDIIQELLLFLAAGHLPTWRDLGFSSLVKDWSLNLFRSFSLNSRSGAVEALNVTGVAAAGGKILATDVSGDSMLNFFQDISSNKFFRRCYAQVFFLHEISSNRYVHDILHGIFMGFYAPVWSFCLQEQSEVGWQGMWPINTSRRHFPRGTTARFPLSTIPFEHFSYMWKRLLVKHCPGSPLDHSRALQRVQSWEERGFLPFVF